MKITLWEYFDGGTTKQCKLTGTVYVMNYNGKWFKGNQETQNNFKTKRR